MFSKCVAAVWWLLALSYPVGLSLAVFAWLDGPRLGLDVRFDEAGNAVIERVQPGSPAWNHGVEKGNVLLRIDGAAIDEPAWRGSGDRGASFAVLAQQSDGTATEVQGRAPQPAGSIIASLWSISVVFAITSFFVFFRSQRSAGVLALSLFLIIGATVIGLAPATARSQPLAHLLVPVLVHWMAASFFVFFYTFHRDRPDRPPLNRAVIAGAVLSALAANAFWVLSVLVMPGSFEAARRLSFVYVGVCVLAGVCLLVRAHLASRSIVLKEQTRIMMVGILAAVTPGVLLSLAPGAMGKTFLVRPEVSVLAIVLVPLSLVYAILRHQFMGIRRLVHRGAAYALISFSILLIYSFLIFALTFVGGRSVGSNLIVQITLLGVLFVAIPFMSGTRRLAFAVVDQVLYREFVNYADLSRRLSIAAAHAQRVDDVARKVLTPLMTELKLSFAALMRVTDGRTSVRASCGRLAEGIVEAVTRDRPAVQPGIASSRTVPLGDYGQMAVVELVRDSSNTWVLCLGPKPTQEPYYREDVALAESITGHIVTTVEKLDLLDELRKKALELRQLNRRLVKAQETERSRIAAYLHDEPLQQVTSLIWKYSHLPVGTAIHEDLQRIAEDLRNFTARLQPALLEDLGLVRALEWLGSEAEAASGIEVTMDCGGVGRDQRLDPDVELALYRIAQEAFTNCQKHSQARRVWLTLRADGERVTLVVEDDGVGPRSPDGARSVTRLGLIGMRERAEQLGGSVEVLPRGPSGTRVVASLPISPKEGMAGTGSQGVHRNDQSVDS